MKRKLLTAALSLLALALVWVGISLAVIAPFLPYGMIDTWPSWVNAATLVISGLIFLGAGVFLWIRAWRRLL